MMAGIVILTILVAVFAPDVPSWIDPYLLLLGFVGLRIEIGRMVVPVLFLGFLKGSGSLDPTWLHLLVAGAGVSLLVVLRQWFLTARLINQVWMTFFLGMVLHGGAIVLLGIAYSHVDLIRLFLETARVCGLTALVAPVFYFMVDRILLRPVQWRRGLLPGA